MARRSSGRPKGCDYSKYSGAHLLTPNLKETSKATPIDITDDEELNEAIRKLKMRLCASRFTHQDDKTVPVFDDPEQIDCRKHF
jgi:bifunctional ADP-heptose synthase (sugar kinase/adenylyltransferase)